MTDIGQYVPLADVDRDRWGRPIIRSAVMDCTVRGCRVPYNHWHATRITTMAKQTDDTDNLTKWRLRLAGKGLATRRDFIAEAATLDLDEDKLLFNKLMEAAFLFGGGDAASRRGTALHKASELHDRGTPIPNLPDEMQRDLDAYIAATTMMDHRLIEQLVVLDSIKVAGTPDRHSKTPWSRDPVIVDIKTGKDMDYSQQAMAAQLAAGALGEIYDPATGERSALKVEQEFGIVVHVPVGKATATLYRVDLVRGRQILGVSTQVHAIRKMRDLLVPFV